MGSIIRLAILVGGVIWIYEKGREQGFREGFAMSSAAQTRFN